MMQFKERGREAPRPEIDEPDIEQFIRRMSVVCDAESRLAAEIQSLDRHHDHVILMRIDISALDVPR